MFLKKITGQGYVGLSDGFSAGLKLWLFFLLSFYFLRYPIPLSILLGAIGGFAGGFMMAWLKSKEEIRIPEPDPIETPGGNSKFSKKKRQQTSSTGGFLGTKKQGLTKRR